MASPAWAGVSVTVTVRAAVPAVYEVALGVTAVIAVAGSMTCKVNEGPAYKAELDPSWPVEVKLLENG